jgi:hypothetical protein
MNRAYIFSSEANGQRNFKENRYFTYLFTDWDYIASTDMING